MVEIIIRVLPLVVLCNVCAYGVYAALRKLA